MAPSLYQNQILTDHQWGFVAFKKRQAEVNILYNEIENYTFKITATYLRFQWVNVSQLYDVYILFDKGHHSYG